MDLYDLYFGQEFLYFSLQLRFDCYFSARSPTSVRRRSALSVDSARCRSSLGGQFVGEFFP